jgi:excisionase family DNA binding protein
MTQFIVHQPSSRQNASWEPLLTPEEAAAHLRIHQKSAIRMAREGKLPAFRLGKHWRFRRADLMAWTEERVQSSGQPAE